jgi:hypothetical protein
MFNRLCMFMCIWHSNWRLELVCWLANSQRIQSTLFATDFWQGWSA